MEAVSTFFKRKDVVISAHRYGIDAMGAMAQGLFASLLIGTIIKTLGQQLGLAFLVTAGGYAAAIAGPAMAASIGYALHAPQLVLFSLIAVGGAANELGGAGGPLAVYLIAIIATEVGKLVSKETKVDILVTPAVTILVGVGLSAFCAPSIGAVASAVGNVIMWATELQPLLMGIVVSVLVGVALTLPISSAAICAALGLTGLAGGAAVAGCCAQMIGFAFMSYRENGVGRPGQPGPGHQHAADAQHPAQSPHLDPPDAGGGYHRPHRHLPVPPGNERPGGLQRHGHLRPGGPDRRLHRLDRGRQGRYRL